MTEPYFQDDTVTLYHGKWQELIDPNLVGDIIIADPPYGETQLNWDTWPKGWPALAATHARSMWCWGSTRMFLAQASEFADWKLSQDVIWEKNTGTSLAKDRFRRVHELALHWYRGAWRDVYHETPTTSDGTAVTVRSKARPAHHQGARGSSTYTSEDGGPRLMRSVMFARNMKGRAINETEKPVPVLEPLIQYACPPGGLVIDLFSGSSAALVAARRTGRRAIGFEMRESQCEQAARRLSQGLLIGDMP